MRNPDYKRTAECLDRILEKERGRIDTSLFGNKIFINSIDRKTLATEIVKRFNCRLDEHGLKSKSNEKYIRENAESWLQSIVEQETGTPTPNQYADFVLAKARDQFKLLTQEERGGDTGYEVYYRNMASEFSERLAAVEEWAKMKREQPAKADEQPQINSDLQKVLETAIEKGFVSKDNGKYKWEGTKRELACFAVIAHERRLTKYKWKDIEELFGEKNLAQENYQATNFTGATPKAKEIEKLFE